MCRLPRLILVFQLASFTKALMSQQARSIREYQPFNSPDHGLAAFPTPNEVSQKYEDTRLLSLQDQDLDFNILPRLGLLNTPRHQDEILDNLARFLLAAEPHDPENKHLMSDAAPNSEYQSQDNGIQDLQREVYQELPFSYNRFLGTEDPEPFEPTTTVQHNNCLTESLDWAPCTLLGKPLTTAMRLQETEENNLEAKEGITMQRDQEGSRMKREINNVLVRKVRDTEKIRYAAQVMPNKMRKGFSSWGGKRTPPFSSWGGKRAPDFHSWGGKRAPDFHSWGGKRSPETSKANQKQGASPLASEGKRLTAFYSWGGKRAPFNSWGGKRAQRFNSWGGKRTTSLNIRGGKQIPFNSWGGKRAPFNSWGGKRSPYANSFKNGDLLLNNIRQMGGLLENTSMENLANMVRNHLPELSNEDHSLDEETNVNLKTKDGWVSSSMTQDKNEINPQNKLA